MGEAIPRHSFPVMGSDFVVDAGTPALSLALIDPSDFEFVKELGSGAYGIVCAARNKRTGDSVAIKKVRSRRR